MRNLAKILALLLVLALCVTGIVLAVSADEPEQTITEPTFAGIKPNLVRIDSAIAAQLVEAGFNYLEFADEAAFNTANAGGYDALAAGGKTGEINVTGGTYIYLLANTTLKSYSISAHNLSTWINLGGNKITWQCNGGTGYAHNLAVFDGDLYHPWFSGTSGHAAYRMSGGSTSNVSVEKVTFSTNSTSGRFFSSEGTATLNLYVNDSTVNAAGKPFVHMGFGAGDAPTVNLILKKTNITTSGAVVNFDNSICTDKSNLSIYIDGASKLDAIILANATIITPTVTVANGASFTANGRAAVQSAGTLVTESGAELYNTEEGTHPFVMMVPPTIPDDTNFTASADFKTANGAFVVYANEFDFYADLEGGVIDGLVDGNSVIVDDNGDTFPTSGYVCMLQNYTLQPASTINVTGKLKINLGGTTFTESSIDTLTVAANGVLGIYNGKLIDGLNSNKPTNTLLAGTTLKVKNVTLETTGNWENWSSTFCFNGTADISFEDCVINHKSMQTTIVKLAGAASYNIDLKNVNYSNSKGHTIATVHNSGYNYINKNGSYYGFVSTNVAATINLSVDKDCVVNSGILVNAMTTGAKITLNAELGFKIWSNDFTTSYIVKSVQDLVNKNNGLPWNPESDLTYTAVTIVDTLNFTENGEIVTASFAKNGDFYVAWKAASVTWYDKNGDVISSVDNLTPDMALTAPKEFVNEIIAVEGGYAIRGGAWSDTEGGSAVEIPTEITAGAAYAFYEVYTEQAATIVVFDGEGGSAVDAYATTKLTKDIVGEFPAGAYVLVCTDLTVDYGEVVDMTFDNYKGDLTIDLGGKTLTQTSYGWGIGMAWATPAAGVTVTIKNGAINVATTATSQNDIATLISGTGAGTLKFHGVDITTLGHVGNIKAGSVVFELCTIKQPNTATNWSTFTIADVSAETSVDLQLLGTCLNVQQNNGARFTSINAGTYAKNISITVSDYEGTYSYIRSAYLYTFTSKGTEKLHADTKLSFTLENCYVSAYNNMISGCGTFLWDTDGTGTYAANAALDKQNVSFTFDNFFYSRNDLFDYEKRKSHVILKTANLNAYKIVSTATSSNSFIAIPELNIDVNLTLYSDFNLNLYIPTDFVADQITYLGQVIFDKSLADTYDVVDGKYKIVIENIAPNKAAKSIELGFVFNETVTFNEGTSMRDRDISHTLTAKYSVIKYAADLIATNDAKSVAAMKALLGYVDAAYDNFDGDESDEATVALLDELIAENGVAAFLAGYTPKASEGDTDFVTVTGVTAAFQIGAVSKLYVTFPAGAEWSIVGDKLTKTGKGGECVIELPAYALTDVLTITVGGETATFSFGEYAEYLMNDGIDNATEDAVLVAMYAYGETARALKAQVDAENA
ncbi:MAG: hypothetical protein IKA64_05335 [Clostridia bacterium]|nr:hypothetical protein [Clostridia bacterium]